MLSFYLSLIVDEPSRSKFESLYLEHRHIMLWMAMKILRDQDLAEDAVHDAFLRVLKNLQIISLENCNKTRSFLVILVRNIAIDYLRKQKQQPEIDLADIDQYMPDYRSDPEQVMLDKAGRQRVLEAMMKMKPIYIDVLLLQISYDFSTQEIADLLNISHDSVRVHIHRARKQMAQLLKGDE